MKTRLFLLLAALSPFTSNCIAAADGGAMGGNGGNGVVCNDASGKPISAELLDLYEGRALYGLTYKESTIDHVNQAVEMGERRR